MSMHRNAEELILEKIEIPSWSTARGVVKVSSVEVEEEDIRQVEEAMIKMAGEGKVDLWTLTMHADGSEMLAASKPGFDLGEELRTRQAWADAKPYESDE
jgi:hypothetical protein